MPACVDQPRDNPHNQVLPDAHVADHYVDTVEDVKNSADALLTVRPHRTNLVQLSQRICKSSLSGGNLSAVESLSGGKSWPSFQEFRILLGATPNGLDFLAWATTFRLVPLGLIV